MATELSHDLSLAFDTYSKVSQAERKYLKLSVEKSVFFFGETVVASVNCPLSLS